MADNFNLKVGVQAQVNQAEVQKQIDNQSKNIKIKTSLEIDKSEITKLQKQIETMAKTQQNAFSNYSKNTYIDTWQKLGKQLDIVADKTDIVKNRAEGAGKNFSSYLKTLKPQALKEYSSQINEISNAFADVSQTGNKISLAKANSQLSNFKSTMKDAGLEASSFTTILKQNIGAFSQWYLIGGAVSSFVGQFKSAISTIIETDTLLTEISKTSNLAGKDLENLGIAAYDAASKYGITVQAYLKGFQEMSRGNDVTKASGLTELSILAQSAGDMTADLANEYIIATNAAYKLNGEVTKLNAILDSQNQITNRNQVNMTDLATATKVAGSQAAQSGVEIDKMTAATGTMIATTKQGGEIAGRAYKAILMNLQQVSGETEDGEILNEESFKKAEKALDDVGVATEGLVNGVAKLRDPMQILKELASVYNSLPNDSAQKAGIISGLGGKHYGNQLAALLSNWKTYEKLLSDYQNASNSAASEAQKTANSIEGRLNKLSNTWNRTVDNVVDSDILKTFITIGTGAVDLADKFDLLQTSLIALSVIGTFKGGSSLISWLSNASSSTIAFGNALNTVKVPSFVASTENLTNVLSGLTAKQMTSVLSTEALSSSLSNLSKEQLEAILTNAGLSAEESKTTVATLSMASAEGVATTSTISLGASFKALGAALVANPIGLVITSLTVGISLLSFGINKYKQEQAELLSNTQESVSAFKEQSTAIDEQINSITELKTKLDIANLSNEESTNVKSQLLEIQKSLIDSYGDEAEGIDLVNGKLEDQIEALRSITKEKASDWLTENQAGIEQATSKMTSKKDYKLGTYITTQSDVGSAIKDIAKEFESQGIKMYDTAEDGATYTIYFKGEATNAEKVIGDFSDKVRELQDTYGNEDIDLNSVLGLTSESYNKAKDILDKYQATYETSIINKAIDSDATSKPFMDYVDAISKYNDALASGDGVNEATTNYDRIKESVITLSKQYPFLSSAIELADKQMITTADSTDTTTTSTDQATDSILSLTDAMSLLAEKGKLIDSVKAEVKDLGTISTDSLNDIVSKYPELESVVAQYNAGLISTKDVLAELSRAYQTDTENYKNAVINKLGESESFYNDVVKGLPQWVKDLANAYGLDFSNYKNLQESKLALDAEYAKKKANLAKAEAAVNTIVSGSLDKDNPLRMFDVNSLDTAKQIEAAMQNDFDNIDRLLGGFNSSLDSSLNIKGYTPSGSSDKSKKNDDPYLDAFNAEKATLDHKLAMDEISEKTYYDKLEKLNNKYFKKHQKKYLEQYRQNQEEIYKGRQQIDEESIQNAYAKQLSTLDTKKQDILNSIEKNDGEGTKTQYDDLRELSDKEIDYYEKKQKKAEDALKTLSKNSDAYKTMQQVIQDCKDSITDAKSEQDDWNDSVLNLPISQLEKANSTLEDTIDKVEGLQSDYDTVIGAVIDSLDDEISSYNSAKEAQEKYYSSAIESKQNELNSLKSANEERQKQLDYEKALYDLERAKNQKSNRIYRQNEGFIYESNTDSIREAQSAVDNFTYETIIKSKEDEIEALEKEKERVLDSYDVQIDSLNKIKEQWSKIADIFDKLKEFNMADMLLGEGWEKRIASGDKTDINLMEKLYGSVEEQLQNAKDQLERNQEAIKNLQEYAKTWQDTEKTVGEAYNKIQEKVNDTLSETDAIQTRIDKTAEYATEWDNTKSTIDTSLGLIEESMTTRKDNEVTLLDERLATLRTFRDEFVKIANDCTSALSTIEANLETAKQKQSELGSLQTATVVTGKVKTAGKSHDGMELGYIGENTANSKDTFRMIALDKLKPDEIPRILQLDEAVLTKLQQNNILGNLTSSFTSGVNTAMTAIKPRESLHPIYQFGDINVNGVQNVSGLAKAIKMNLGNVLNQELNKK